jgi:nitrilase
MPTNPERMVWGFGDASGLRVIDTPCGRIGSLICWENYMPLARFALYASGVEIYIAPTYDSGDRWVGTLQHIAREGGCWVVGNGMAFRARDIPDAVLGKLDLYRDPEEWVNDGDSVVVEPGGRIAAGPMRRELGILYADIDCERVGIARRSLDVAGHYSRPDLFQLHVNTSPLNPWSSRDRTSVPREEDVNQLGEKDDASEFPLLYRTDYRMGIRRGCRTVEPQSSTAE